MDVYCIQIDPSALQDMKKVASQILGVVERARPEYEGHPIILGTADYSLYIPLLQSPISPRLLWQDLSPEGERELHREAEEFARGVILEVAGDVRLLFKGVNILDILLFDLTVHVCRTLLLIRHAIESMKEKPGLLILLTSLPFFSTIVTNNELRVVKLIQIHGRRFRSTRLAMSLLRSFQSRARRAPVTAGTEKKIPKILDDKKRVLFVVTDTRKNYDNAIPLVSILRELMKHRNLAHFVAVDNALTEGYLREHGFGCAKYTGAQNWEAKRHWSENGPVIRMKAMKLTEKFGPGTVKGLMVSIFLRVYLTWGTLSPIYSRIAWLDEVYDQFRPDIVVILFTYALLGNAAARLARVREIPTLGTNFGYAYAVTYDFGLYDVTDFVATTGEKFKEALEASGVDPRRCIAVGNPMFDPILTRVAARDREYVCREFGVEPNARIFLVASRLISPGTTQWVRALVRQLKKFDHDAFKLIIKPHPDESSEEYERILSAGDFTRGAISRDVPLYTLLSASDIVFTSVSVAGYEAVLFNKPLICINLTDIPYSVRYDEEGVALLVEKEEDILATIEAILHDAGVKQQLENARKRFQQLHAYLDGRSSIRLVNAIEQIASEAKKNAQEAPPSDATRMSFRM